MSVGRKKPAILVFLVIVLEFVHSGKREQGIPLVHLHAERVQNVGSILCLLDDCVLRLLFLGTSRWENGKIVLEKALVGSELDHLGVNEHELELRRVLGIEQGGHYHVKSHRLTLLRSARYKKVRSLSEVKHLDVPCDCAAYGHRKFGLCVAESIIIEHGLERHHGRLAVGDLDSDGIVKLHDADALCPERDSDVALHGLD